ncbi:prepilin peptidase [candidate division GN15 bacterium]|nr:prepilin peptidase [candidate division GN15 bacterium]
MEIIYYCLVGAVGLCLGSFLNALIYRIPRKLPFVMNRSVCPKCSSQLKWYHNIPLVSYLFLRGKCAFCGERISPRYPIVELANAGLYLYFYWQLGFTVDFFIFAYLSSVLLAIFLIDLDHQLIPNFFTYSGIVLGLGLSFVPGGLSPVQSLIGFLVGGGSLYLIALLGDWLFKKESMGGGDIKMAAMLGAFLGWQKVLFVFIASAAIGLVVSIIMMLLSARMREERVIPFGPFLAGAAMLAILYGDRIIEFYVTNFLPAQ